MNPSDPNSSKKGIDLAAVRRIVEPIALAHGVRLDEVEWSSGRAGRILRITIDRHEPSTPEPNGAYVPTGVAGVGIDDCARVSRDISTAFDVTDPIGQAYALEVSSPGLDRPLRNGGDFARQIGKLAKVRLSVPAADGQRVLRGTITAVDSERVHLEVDGNAHYVPLADVADAKLVFDFRSAKRAKDSGRSKKARKKERARSRGQRNTKRSRALRSVAETTPANPKKSRNNRAG